MFRDARILFPTDFSHYALHAFRYAVALGRTCGNPIEIIHVTDKRPFRSAHAGLGMWLGKTDLDKLVDTLHEHAISRLEHLKQLAALHDAKAEYQEFEGYPPEEIVAAAEQLKCGLIVLATHGRTGLEHLLLGGTCERVVRTSSVPVLSVKRPAHDFVDDEDAPIRIRRVLFPTDFSVYSREVLPYAVSLAREFGARLTLFHVAEVPVAVPEFLPDTAGAVGAPMLEHARTALEGMAAEVEDVETDVDAIVGLAYRDVCARAKEMEADVIVLGTHGRKGLAHWLYGSVAERVVRYAPCPVLTVRPKVREGDDTA